MAEVINLRQARKRADRKKKGEQAHANRIAHGQPKALRSRAEVERERASRILDAHRITTEDE